MPRLSAATIAGMAGSRKQWRHPKAISEHAFDKLHVIDCTLAELDTALDSAEIIDERELDDGTSKELLLVVDWKRPLHVVVVVDDVRREDRDGLRAPRRAVDGGLP